ncbi:MAG TPA: hypothetical protein VK586_15815 [Streptosporangiaceae bacterium]|nr:hypothetical protein [Streptosporangiaceae bacterium]
MSNTIETAVQGGDALDALAVVYRKAGELTARVNPGADVTSPAFAAKRAEVAEVITRRLCADLTGQGRPDLSRKIRLAWNRSA